MRNWIQKQAEVRAFPTWSVKWHFTMEVLDFGGTVFLEVFPTVSQRSFPSHHPFLQWALYFKDAVLRETEGTHAWRWIWETSRELEQSLLFWDPKRVPEAKECRPRGDAQA